MFLTDTNIISELRKGQRCDTNVAAWYASVNETDVFISALTLGEIRKGIELSRRRNDFQQAALLERWLQEFKQSFSARILSIDDEIADAWGHLNAIRPVSAVDGLLTATAQVHGLILVTRNIRHVQGLGVPLLNPFT